MHGFNEEELIELSVKYNEIDVFGLNIILSESVIVSWVVMGILILFSFYVYFIALPKFKTKPAGFQNFVELFVEWIYKFSNEKIHRYGNNFAPYAGTICIYLILANTIELIGLRPPTTNIGVTFSLAVLTFIMINYYGAKRHGVLGRIGQFAKPMVFLAPIKMATELAVPISLSARLYGNILVGLVVMELVYKLVPIGVPAVLSIYFNLFDGLIQTFIFVVLTLTFVGEASE